MNNPSQEQVLAVVVDTIRTTIAEDWIEDYEIGPQTRFNEDLEIESIEFVKIADAIMAKFGGGVDIVGWLSGKTIHELINLRVGDVSQYIAARLSPT